MQDKDRSEEVPLSALVAQRGIKTSCDFADFMSGLMCDLVENRIDPDTAKAACMAGSQLLSAVKLQLQYGKEKDGVREPLRLSGQPTAKTLTTSSEQKGQGPSDRFAGGKS
jgi:hypothetical protein